jgi:hypothetical protein
MVIGTHPKQSSKQSNRQKMCSPSIQGFRSWALAGAALSVCIRCSSLEKAIRLNLDDIQRTSQSSPTDKFDDKLTSFYIVRAKSLFIQWSTFLATVGSNSMSRRVAVKQRTSLGSRAVSRVRGRSKQRSFQGSTKSRSEAACKSWFASRE